MKPTIAWFFSDWDTNAYRTMNDLYGGIGYYRVIKPAQSLAKWFDIEVVGADFQHWGTTDETYNRLKDYDLIISKHSRSSQQASNILAAAEHFNKKVLLDMDDNYFEIRKDNPAFKDYEYGQGAREFMGAFLSLADGLTVSTEPLKKVYSKLNKKIDVLPNCNDIRDWPNVRKMWDDGKVRIGFAGGLGHLADLEIVLEPLSYILAKYPNVYFQMMGGIWPREAMEIVNKMNDYCKKNIAERVMVGGGTQAWQGYPEMLASNGWDIIIAPLVDDPFNKCKSHIRWLESSMVYCPVVASQVYPYYKTIQGVKTIEHGKTGLFATTAESWFTQLEILINDVAYRREIAQNAYNYVKENWQYDDWALNWKKVIEKYI